MSYGPELVPKTPIYIDGRLFDTSKCADTTDGPHFCAHDWRCFWGNQNRPDE